MKKLDREIPWSNFLAVGAAAMDAGHRLFIERVSELNTAMAEAADRPAIEHLLQDDLEYEDFLRSQNPSQSA